MKLLVFAHVPPPHHGQSYMVKLMLDGFGGDVRQRSRSEIRNPSRAERDSLPTAARRGAAEAASKSGIDCYHINARLSSDLEDIGSFHLSKVLLLLRYCLQAIGCRFRHGVHAFYYVPAPGKRAALYRDWIVMLLCRPFFRHVIHHWHAVGLGDWLQKEGTWFERWLTHRLLGKPDLGVAITIPSMRDALWFRSRRVTLVANGIPDPCPDYETTVRPRRGTLRAARLRLLAGESVPASVSEDDDPKILRVLFLSHCTPEKGLTDTLEGVALANRRLRDSGAPWKMQLTVAGQFLSETAEAAFRERIAAADLAGTVSYVGFAQGEAKRRLLERSDTLCFPSYYPAESFGLVLVEAMAAGLNVVATRWRATPDVMPSDYPGIVPVRAPERVAESLIQTFAADGSALREFMLTHYTVRHFVQSLAAALEGPLLAH